MEVQPATAVIGAEVVGADLENLTDSQFGEIEQAFTDHLVLFFRDQPPLSPEAHLSFARRFGELHIHPIAPGPSDHPEIMTIHADANSKYADGNNWHTDVSPIRCKEESANTATREPVQMHAQSKPWQSTAAQSTG